MGMDVYGRSPISETGHYFRNNLWWWHPLWNYCMSIAPDLIPRDNLGHCNSGWGLNRRKSQALAERLALALAAGETEQYAQDYMARLEQLPDAPCITCDATGYRAEPPNVGPGTQACNGCNATGYAPNFAKNFPFSVENVREFEAFLRDCGGFKIC